jgi:hypothetical protein
MTVISGFLADVTRATVTYAVAHRPKDETIETAAGVMVICSFALIGLLLPALP